MENELAAWAGDPKSRRTAVSRESPAPKSALLFGFAEARQTDVAHQQAIEQKA